MIIWTKSMIKLYKKKNLQCCVIMMNDDQKKKKKWFDIDWKEIIINRNIFSFFHFFFFVVWEKSKAFPTKPNEYQIWFFNLWFRQFPLPTLITISGVLINETNNIWSYFFRQINHQVELLKCFFFFRFYVARMCWRFFLFLYLWFAHSLHVCMDIDVARLVCGVMWFDVCVCFSLTKDVCFVFMYRNNEKKWLLFFFLMKCWRNFVCLKNSRKSFIRMMMMIRVMIFDDDD